MEGPFPGLFTSPTISFISKYKKSLLDTFWGPGTGNKHVTSLVSFLCQTKSKRWILLCPFHRKEKEKLSSLPKVTQQDLLFPRPSALTIGLDCSLSVGCECVCVCVGVLGAGAV